MSKGKLISIIAGLGILVIILFLLTGNARTDVYLKSFSVDKKCNQMTIEVGVSSSAGYVRKMKQTSGSMNYYYTFYSTFGINSKLGARDTFEIQLDNNVDEIYFYTGQNGYKKVLEKNNLGEWVSVQSYDLVTSLEKNIYASTEILVRFDGELYGKSNLVIDYALEGEKIGIIDKLVDEEYIPKLDNETNQEEILNAEVYDKTDNTIVLLYNNVYTLFERIMREEQYQFIGTIVEAHDNFIVVEPEEGSNERKSSDKISMEINRPTSGINDFYVVGNKVKITYNGNIAESYPAQIGAIKIELAK